MYRYKNNRLEVLNPKTNKYVKAEYTRADGRIVKSSYYYKLKNQNAIMSFNDYKKQVLTRAKEQLAGQKIKTLLSSVSSSPKENVVITIKFKVLEGRNKESRLKNVSFTNMKVPSQLIKNKSFIQKKMKQLIKEWIREQIANHKEDYNIEFEEIINYKVLPFNPIPLKKVKVKGVSLMYKLLGDRQILNYGNKDLCVLDYIYTVLKEKNEFKSITIEKLKNEFPDHKNGISTEEVIEWAKMKKYISVYALNPFLRVFENYTAEFSRCALVFIINNKHCYPVLDDTLTQMVYKNKQIFLNKYTFFINGDDEFDVFNDGDNYEDMVQGTFGSNKRLLLINSNKLMMIDIINSIVKHSKTLVESIHFNSSNEAVAFVHPTTDVIYLHAPDYDMRKDIMTKLHEKLNIEELKFKNQSFPEIANNILTYFLYKEPEASEYNHQVLDIIDTYRPSPVIYQYQTKNDGSKEKYAFDVKKSYSKFLKDNTYDYPIFTVCDEVQPFKNTTHIAPGLYYLDKTIFLTCDKTIFLEKGYYTHMTIDKAIKRGCLNPDQDIKFFIQAGHHHKSDFFKELVCYVFEHFSVDEAKLIINAFTGVLGIRYNSKNFGCITDDWETALSLVHGEASRNKEARAIALDDYFFVRSKEKTRKMKDFVPFYMMVIEGGMWNVVDLHDAIFVPGQSQVSYIKTDCIGIINPRESEVLKLMPTLPANITEEEATNMSLDEYAKVVIKPETDMIGGYKFDDYKPTGKAPTFDKNSEYIYERPAWKKYKEPEDFNQYLHDLEKMESFFIQGDGGCGKSYTVVELMKRMTDKHFEVLTFTNKAAIELRIKGSKAITLDLLFFDVDKKDGWTKLIKRLSKCYAIVIDEFSMIPLKFLSKLLRIKKELPEINFWILGDMKQLKPVNTDGRKQYRYENSAVMMHLCKSNYIDAVYKTSSGRYDQKSYEILSNFTKTNTLKHKLLEKKKLQPKLMTNLSYRVATCERVNNECREIFIKENPNAEKINDVFSVGMKVICNKNIPKDDVFNSETFVITKYENDMITIENDYKTSHIHIKNFCKDFSLSYCITIHRAQGMTISEAYNVYDVHIMYKELMYVALSRCRSIDNVYFDYNERYFNPDKVVDGSILREGNAQDTGDKYINGKIYGIYNGNILLYIGQTINSLEKRLKEHMCGGDDDFHKHLKSIDTNKVNIKLIKECPCASLHELLSEESRQIKKHLEEGHELKNTIHNHQPKTTKKSECDTVEIIVKARENMIKDRFKLKEKASERCFQLIYTDEHGDSKTKKIRYGTISRDEAYEKMMNIRSELINNLFNI